MKSLKERAEANPASVHTMPRNPYLPEGSQRMCKLCKGAPVVRLGARGRYLAYCHGCVLDGAADADRAFKQAAAVLNSRARANAGR